MNMLEKTPGRKKVTMLLMLNLLPGIEMRRSSSRFFLQESVLRAKCNNMAATEEESRSSG
jgi:hypothetical protein